MAWVLGRTQIGPGILRQVSDYYRKLRGMLRYLLGALSDYTPDMQAGYRACGPASARA